MSIKKDGIEMQGEERFGIKVYTVHVKSEEAAHDLQREMGSYITLTLPCQIQKQTEIYAASECIASVLKEILLPYHKKKLCICGIGNSLHTADSLGPSVVRKLSLHALTAFSKEYWYFQDIFGVIPEVPCYTNFPTEKIVSAVVREMQADCILLIDSMIASDYKNLYTTVQISTNGGLSSFLTQSQPDWEMANLPVISLGMPMAIKAEKGFKEALGTELLVNENISEIIEKASIIITYALIRTGWEDLSPEEVFTLLFSSMQLREITGEQAQIQN